MTMMTDDRLRDILASYGAEPENWPHAERAAAERLLRQAPDRFADAVEAARLADSALAAERVDVTVPAGLVDRIIAQAPRPESRSLLPAQIDRLFGLPGLAAGLASLAIGVMIGVQLPSGTTDNLIEDEIWADSSGVFEFYDGLSEDG